MYVPRGIEGRLPSHDTSGYRWVGSVGRCLPVLQPEEAKRRRRRRRDLWRLHTASYRLLVCLPIRATSEPSDQTKLQSTPRTQTVQTCQPGRHTRSNSTLSRATDLLSNTEIPTVGSVILYAHYSSFFLQLTAFREFRSFVESLRFYSSSKIILYGRELLDVARGRVLIRILSVSIGKSIHIIALSSM